MTSYNIVYRYLPVVRQGADETARQFADKTQQVVGKALDLACTRFDYNDIQKWIGSCELIITVFFLSTQLQPIIR